MIFCKWKQVCIVVIGCTLITGNIRAKAAEIDRKAVVSRHNLLITDPKLKGPTQVGNSEFAYGFDITGMQTFSEDANTMAHWGWHQFPMPPGQTPKEFKGQTWDTQGRMVRYDIQNPAQEALTKWMIANPQRINLGRFGLVLKNKNGTQVVLSDLKNTEQRLDLWTGIAVSTFEVDGKSVKVTTIGHPEQDAVAVRIEAPDLNDGRIGVSLKFPYASLVEFGNGADWASPEKHETRVEKDEHELRFYRTMDDTQYGACLSWKGNATLQESAKHEVILTPKSKHVWELVLRFDKVENHQKLPDFAATARASKVHWQKFWQSGGCIDLSASKDSRWKELERRIVLSQYVMAVNEAGSLPPQESGLVNNGWFGKYHYEMIWWHGTHYALWNRWNMVDSSLKIYARHLETFKAKAREQGYEGVRWPKTIGNQAYWEWPNEINPLLIWQQPHPIFFAELDYRLHPNQATLAKWKDVVLQSADFMASYPYYNQKENRYILGYPLQVVSENANPRITFNPTFELSYWRTGLRLAQEWRKRLNLGESKRYTEVLNKLSKLPVEDGLYVSWENIDSMWHKYTFEHPALTGAFGMLPGDGVDTATMEKTLKKVLQTWRLDQTWGWDFPMLAMCAARLGHGDLAVDLLLNYPSFKLEEHGLVDGGGPFPYFPGNGGLLYAVALMAAGWDGAPDKDAPGFPQDGSWVVKWEGLKKAL